MVAAKDSSPHSTSLALFTVFCIYSRLHEIIPILLQKTIPYVLSVMLIMVFLSALMSGRLMHFVSSNTTFRYYVLFTLWMLPCSVFGFWPGGSVHLLIYGWLPVFVGIAGIGCMLYTWRDIRQVRLMIAMSSVLIAVFSMVFGVFDENGRLLIRGGTLGNSNDLALLVLVGLPFLFSYWLDKDSGNLAKIMALMGIPLMILAVLRTGSRAGLLTLMMVLFLVFLLSGINRFKVLALGSLMALIAALALTAVNSMVVDRLATLFKDDNTSEATMSTKHRTMKFFESVEMTVRNPIFGVGPGVHVAAQADVDNKAGRRADWLVAHNSMTQISSETGFPGLILYSAAIFGSFWRLWKARRAFLRIPSLEGHANLLGMYLLSGISMFVLNLFGTNGYLPYMPLLLVLISNVAITAQESVEQERRKLATSNAFPGNVNNSRGFVRPPVRPSFGRPAPVPVSRFAPSRPLR